jgi:hypothetical protein
MWHHAQSRYGSMSLWYVKKGACECDDEASKGRQAKALCSCLFFWGSAPVVWL